MRFPINLRYLHEKPLPRYPLWYPGNPRTRLFLPQFWLRIVENRVETPPDFVKFECHWQMTSSDVKQYLQKLYGVNVLDCRIEIEAGKYMPHPKKKNALSPPLPDRKYAYIQLKDTKFEFPKLFAKSSQNIEAEKNEKQIRNMEYKQKNNELNRGGIGNWFF